ncbi:hypothetical protein GDO86_004108 [Hymenochirus boettgeri]|uniref:Uncharacterized protein n=1 Tax=Hymenochirus boettgeri TaxID=247094 RepID=A0A8T2K6L2_9PIPI|nr:hypothetical protein GDO86_004108 [Hymenochirus boettgeri]
MGCAAICFQSAYYHLFFVQIFIRIAVHHSEASLNEQPVVKLFVSMLYFLNKAILNLDKCLHRNIFLIYFHCIFICALKD